MSLSPFAGARDRPVFVGACPRSGTTLLRTMLDCHPELSLPRETRFVLEAWSQRRRFGDLEDRENRRALARFIFHRKGSRHKLLQVSPKIGVRELVASPPTLGSLLGRALSLYGGDTPRWGDKRPAYLQQLDTVLALFPDLQFVHIVRDPRSVVASLLDIGWFDGSAVRALEAWERSMRAADRARRRLMDDQFIELEYEKLVAKPEQTLTWLCERLGIDPAGVAAMLDYHEGGDLPSWRKHVNVSRPVDPQLVGRWPERLEPPAIALIEHATRDRMAALGYEASGVGRPVSGALRRQLAVSRARGRARQLRHQLGDRRTAARYPFAVAARLTTSQRRVADRR